ncbi:MAG: archaetidylserine decarboxylase [Myxococcota bacterium]
MKDALIVSALSLLPRKPAARGMGAVARTRASRWLTRAFVQAYGVDLSEAEGELADYPTLEDLFTRTLKPGSRPIDPAPDALVSPVDGTVAAAGRTENGLIEVAPGRTLDVADLLGMEPGDPIEFDTAVLYLSPKDYHRVHVPREGTAVSWSYLPGTLWPVFPAAVRRVDNLFSKNERFRVTVDTSGGPLEVVLVGAFGVGRITVGVTDLVTNAGADAATGTLDPGVAVERGEWLGTFHLGSTVILAAPAGRIRWEVEPGTGVRFGVRIGTLGSGSGTDDPGASEDVKRGSEC